MAESVDPQSLPRPQIAILCITAAWTIYCLLSSPYAYYAPLQNGPTLVLLGGAAVWARRRPIPTSALACVCGFLMLHALGGKYIYSYVPYDRWGQALGLPSPNQLLHLNRNSYDRLVHFSFGLLLVHPISTALERAGNVGRRLSLYIAVEFVLAGSCLYEIFEWLLTVFLAGADADAYNGQQGDMWDSQKDMACAAVGAISAAAGLTLRRALISRSAAT